MSSKPILFSGAMVEAILAGRKTQTRRLIKMRDGSLCDDDDIPTYDEVRLDYVMDFSKTYPYWQQLDCPKGKTGDLLWVRESWQAQTQNGKWWHEVKREDRPLLNWAWTNPVKPAFESVPPRWLPSIHMPREASRINLRIVNVCVEKLQEISNEDSQAEGVYPLTLESNGVRYDDYKGIYASLWNSINDKEGKRWEDNPWVWVIKFQVVN